MSRGGFALIVVLGVSGCMVGPDYQRPEVETPARWSEASRSDFARISRDNATWWRTFDDPMLNALIAEAIGYNLDVKQAKERIVEARSQRVIAVAAGLPLINARSYANRRQNNFTGQSGNSVIGTTGGFGLGGQHIDIFQMGFDASWELDIFGHIRRGIEAADARIGYEVDNARDVLVTLLGEVARNYLDLRLAQRQVVIARDNLTAQNDTHELTRHRHRAGLSSELDVAQATSQVATTEAQIPLYQARIKLATHALAVLLGRNPADLNRMLHSEGQIPVSPLRSIADLPSDLLRRRPDIQRAERELAAATAEVGRATAELYPKLNLSTFLGFQNNDVTDFTLLGKSWSVGSTLTAPVLNWGSNIANLEAKEAGAREALFAYRSTVLNAFREVEDALVAYATEQQRLESLQRAVAADQLAVKLAEERYLRGLADFLNVLVAQRALLNSQGQVADSAARVSADLIALYKALGGGWQIDPLLVGPEGG